MAGPAPNALAEFGRRPLGFKVGVFAAIAGALGLLYFQFMLRPLQKKLKAAQAQNESLKQESDDLDTQIDQINKMVAKRTALDKQLEEDRKALPTEAELPSFFDTLNRKVGDAGVEVKRWEYKKEVPVEDFYRVPVDIELTGTFEQLKRFFSSLLPHDDSAGGADLPTEKERIITIEDLTLSDPTPKNGEIVMTAKFTASTFRQDEAKTAAGSAAAPAPATAPPATTPAPAAAPAAGSGSGSGSAKSSSLLDAPKDVKNEVNADMQQVKARDGSAHPDGNAKLKGGM